MRAWSPLLALALLLTGCAQPGDDGRPSTMDTGSSGTSSPSSTSGPPAGNPGFAIQQGQAHGANQSIEVDVRWQACEAGFCANATARNNGTNVVQISSICQSPWEERMTHNGQAVQPHPMEATCMAFGRAPFSPGESRQADFIWDGQLYDSGKGVPAPQGAYTWSIAFWWDDGQGADRGEAAADIQLIIGET